MLVQSRGYTHAQIILTDKLERPVASAKAGTGFTTGALEALLDSGQLPPCCELARISKKVVVISEDNQKVCLGCPVAGLEGTDIMCVHLANEEGAYGYLIVVVEPTAIINQEEISLFTELAQDITFALRSLEIDEARALMEKENASLQEQIAQAQKLESIGRLAGGVAHDYNNMLSVITGNAEMALGKLEPASPLHEELTEILDAAERSADITRQLLAFARKQTISPKVLNLNETVESMLRMLSRLIGEDIDLQWVPADELWPVKLDPSQIDQILANLCVNARDAIDGVGKVTIETNMVSLDAAYCFEHAEALPGEYVMLAVSDDGCGIDSATLLKIFEPFYTTKEHEGGTGLGLATVYGIVKQNEGSINVYSEPGGGTTFKVYLPRYVGDDVVMPEPASLETQVGHGELVLLVEDEEAIRRISRAMLEVLGYSVLAAGTPSDALRLAQLQTGPIHLLMTDVVMPEMNGRDLATQLQQLRPDLKILFVSGYTANVIAHRGVLEEGVHFLHKPFTLKELARKVREALEQD